MMHQPAFSKQNFRTFDNIIRLDLGCQFETTEVVKTSQTTIDQFTQIQVLDEVLTGNECRFLLEKTKIKESLEFEYEPTKRDSTRSIYECPQLQKILWDRTYRVIYEIAKQYQLIPMGFGTEGSWDPISINQCIRFSEYRPQSQGFLHHRDSAFVKTANERSIFTFLVYLNDLSDGQGATHFYRSSNFDKDAQISQEKLELIEIVHAVRGRAIIFNHEIPHRGMPLNRSTCSKNIFRTDIIFRRQTGYFYTPITNWRFSPQFIECANFWHKAFMNELKGNLIEAGVCYETSLNYRISELYDRQQRSQRNQITLKSLWPSINFDLLECIVSFIPKNNLKSICKNYYTMLNNIKQTHMISEILSVEKTQCSQYYDNRRFSMPKLLERKGIETILTYPKYFYKKKQAQCVRAIAFYAMALFSHNDACAGKDQVDIRYVFSFDRETGLVIWSYMGDIIDDVSHGETINAQQSTLADFNSGISNECTPIKIKYTYSIQNVDPESVRNRYSITFSSNLCQPFFHAASCCCERCSSKGGRCKITRLDEYTRILEKKRIRQKHTKMRQSNQNSEELRMNDCENCHSTRTIIVQEIRNKFEPTSYKSRSNYDKIQSFKVIYIGIGVL
jgi:prolyl 4-hydroxylase